MPLLRRKSLDKKRIGRSEDRIAATREYAIAIRRLVQSPDYKYVKQEAAKVVGAHLPTIPTSVDTLIAWFSATLMQNAYSRLFTQLEYIANHIPEPAAPSTTKKRST